MDPRTQERVERWDSRPFSNGYDGLSALATEDFSGAVTAGETWLFMLNGRVVGVVDGTIDAFENATGTTYVAPDPALPLLCSMQAAGGETRAKYYTKETPLTDVDETLTENSFTGYVELSEGVLSGDYYLVYYGGRRMAAAYIGNAERLLTDEEAFERAADEVGIYEVIDVDIDVTDVPSGDGSGAATVTTGTDATDGNETNSPSSTQTDGDSDPAPQSDGSPSGITTAGADAQQTDQTPQGASDDTSGSIVDEVESYESESESESTFDSDAEPSFDSDANEPNPDDLEAAAEELTEDGVPWADVEDELDTDPEPESEPELGPELVPSSASEPGPRSEPVDSDSRWDENPTNESDDQRPVPDEAGVGTAKTGDDEPNSELDERFKQEEQWRETRSIPSIDPDKTSESAANSHRRSSAQPSRQNAAVADRSGGRSQRRDSTYAGPPPSHSTTEQRTSTTRSTPASTSTSPENPDTLESDMLEREDKIDQLTQRIDDLESERETLRAEKAELERERDRLESANQELSATVERLESRIEDLESELEELRAEGASVGASTGHAGTETQLSPQEALAGTNIFVRYESKSRPTLEMAHAGEADPTTVGSNLRLERHTQFDEDDVTVEGRPYGTFLTDTLEYRFVEWLTDTLLYEIRDTDHANALPDLYDAIPRIDHAELRAELSLEDDTTEDVPDGITFDVVAFDKRGSPLIVADLNHSREPATREMLIDLEESSSAIKANYPDLAAAMVVTSSYFDPGALEIAEQATTGGFLSRGSKLSYVNLSRKQGYHLCLVESRSGGFHMNVPEL